MRLDLPDVRRSIKVAFALWTLFCLSVSGVIVYILIHFLLKAW